MGLDRLDVVVEDREHALLRLVAERARRVDALAEPRDDRAPIELGQRPAGDVGDQEPCRVGADVDDGDAHQ